MKPELARTDSLREPEKDASNGGYEANIGPKMALKLGQMVRNCLLSFIIGWLVGAEIIQPSLLWGV